MGAREELAAAAPDAWRDVRDGRIYVNGRKYEDDPLYAYDPNRHATALWYVDEVTLARLLDEARREALREAADLVWRRGRICADAHGESCLGWVAYKDAHNVIADRTNTVGGEGDA